ncbi:hypothetical protein [Echinicola shivajiensis]|uniref:hypothetical protein n=1 Tax=Echinicola shivajiensis TaxID=1035916 RepID=UPI001BFC26F9|nr:hypothetical protein [Echinicola shivajiensis]
MNNIQKDELIKTLILQDLKHCQLLYGLDRLNLDAGYCHFLSILDLISKLMEISDDDVNDFIETYMLFMNKCMDYPLSKTGEELKPLAEECYMVLTEIQKEVPTA